MTDTDTELTAEQALKLPSGTPLIVIDDRHGSFSDDIRRGERVYVSGVATTSYEPNISLQGKKGWYHHARFSLAMVDTNKESEQLELDARLKHLMDACSINDGHNCEFEAIHQKHNYDTQGARREAYKIVLSLLHQQLEANTPISDTVSPCTTCYCMTKTVGRFASCGKCGAQKLFTQAEMEAKIAESHMYEQDRFTHALRTISDVIKTGDINTAALPLLIDTITEQLTTNNKQEPES